MAHSVHSHSDDADEADEADENDADQDHDQAKAKRPWLGVFLSEDSDGVTISGVKEGSPASKAGLKEGDRFVEIDNKKIGDAEDIRNAIRKLEPGDTVEVVVERDGREKTVHPVLGEAPKHFGENFSWGNGQGFGPMMNFNAPVSKTYLGVRVQGMTDDLRAYFKAPHGRGVLVSKVEEDTPADRAGLRAGDVIVSVDGKAISNRGDIGSALMHKEPGDTVAVKVIRDGTPRTIDVEVAERSTPKARHGMLAIPDDDSLFENDDSDNDGHHHESDDIEEEDIPDHSKIQLEIEKALEKAHLALEQCDELNQEKIQQEIRRSMKDAKLAQMEAQRQIEQELVAANVSTKFQDKMIKQQIKAAMDQARQALREAELAAQTDEESDGI
jgi:membrane-associated protease RseP (regulator of RpoE activity)